MCYAIPGQVKRIEEKVVVVDYFGEEKKAYNELDDLQIGDYIYAQGGFVIKKLAPYEAESILSTWKEIFFDLQETDLRLSRLDAEKEGIDKKLARIMDKASEGRVLKKEELLYLLDLKDPKEMEILFKTANFVRQKHLKNSCCVHGIIEISNICSCECRYCGIAADNKKLKRYRMTRKEIMNAAKTAIEKHGFQALVLQSGENCGYSADELADIVREIKKNHQCLIFVSFGEVGLDGLEKLYKAGARGLLMRFETSNPELYEKIHPGRKLETRIAHLEKAYDLGYLILTGGLIGLPGQTQEDIINDLFLAKALHAEMYSFGPFLPHPKTSLGKEPFPDEDLVCKTLALARFIDPENAKILVTTGFETLSKNARKKGLLAGANSVMLNVTPMKFRSQYSIYPKRAHDKESIPFQIEETLKSLKSLGRAPTDLGVNSD